MNCFDTSHMSYLIVGDVVRKPAFDIIAAQAHFLRLRAIKPRGGAAPVAKNPVLLA